MRRPDLALKSTPWDSADYLKTEADRTAYLEACMAAGQLDADSSETLKACLMGVVLFPIVIPWRYVLDNYVRQPADRWRSKTAVGVG